MPIIQYLLKLKVAHGLYSAGSYLLYLQKHAAQTLQILRLREQYM